MTRMRGSDGGGSSTAVAYVNEWVVFPQTRLELCERKGDFTWSEHMRCEVLAAGAQGLHVELHLDLGSVSKNFLAGLFFL
jgi:hypothetical protein